MAPRSFSDYMDRIEKTIEKYVQKAPSLPNSWKEFLVTAMPWYIGFVILLNLPIFFSLFGFASLTSPFVYIFGSKVSGITATLILSAGILVLQIMAEQGLFSRKRKSWKLLFYSALLGIVHGIFVGSMFSVLIIGVITLYLLFQIKSYYNS
ncbi:hypothetical protein COU88_03940 [Candidatus Roizmanbacteria bacterium CG10_big_fil_rev_8_21_14_0_10_39_6]|uniref:Chromate transporter n=1 Tax=Candidatus Roizmanbacteria bacterium CG10_big_fil_rev_8_21_14_0_10_39_6 TaxID=1974853 RepID=A0A2M8KRS8_9BACT|nr:MAG: hypothetical protein COU88_03940 [Candidatus Roizmanbacteria bacterium CG10_big_fil_rev_8_21_14_0_10_39_6]